MQQFFFFFFFQLALVISNSRRVFSFSNIAHQGVSYAQIKRFCSSPFCFFEIFFVLYICFVNLFSLPQRRICSSMLAEKKGSTPRFAR